MPSILHLDSLQLCLLLRLLTFASSRLWWIVALLGLADETTSGAILAFAVLVSAL